MSDKIKQLFDVVRQDGKDIGIEIEMEGEHLKYPISRYWRGTNDGSLRGESLEYVLKSPVSRDMTKQRLQFLKNELEAHDSKLHPSDRCGVHIHVNCQDLTVCQVINFSIVYLILEELLVEMCGEQRIGNLFCLRASDADLIITALRICKQEDSLNPIQNRRYRYASINLAAISKFGSVEFRSFQTPKNIMKIQKWIEILLRIKDYSLEFNEGYHIIENVSMGGPAQFVQNVLGIDAALLSKIGRERIITEGVRRVQEIAYAPPVKNKQRKKDEAIYGQVPDPVFPEPPPIPPVLRERQVAAVQNWIIHNE